MEEIKVGEYGRTNLGKIIKFAWLYDENEIIEKNKVILVDLMLIEPRPYYYFKKDEYIVKHRPNIIDLIEEGDYVNGYRVIKKLNNSLLYTNGIEELTLYNSFAPNGVQHYQPILITEDEIKSIVTKEMMKLVEYRVV